MIFKHGILAALLGVVLAARPFPAAAGATIDVKAGFIRAPHVQETLSILDIPAADDGIAGAKLAAEDNNTTGRFLGQTYTIEDVRLQPGDDPAAALNGLLQHGVSFVLADLPAAALLTLAEAAKDKGVLIFNTSAPEDLLREENCRANVFHVAPSYSMLADGLAQYLVWKQWKRWLLFKGSHPQDELYAEALARAAKKFGAKIVEERIYEDTGGGRRSDLGACRRKGLFRWRHKTHRPMMYSSSPTKAKSLRTIFPSAHGTRGRSPARPGLSH